MSGKALPKKYPANIIENTQAIQPIILYQINFLKSKDTTPAIMGTKVHTIGINLAIIIAEPPCFS